MPFDWILVAILALFALGPLAVTLRRWPNFARVLVYGGAGIASALICLAALLLLLRQGNAVAMWLPIGLPATALDGAGMIGGAHLRLDALGAFFLAVTSLGGVAASIYGLGYGRHESAPLRVLPFYPVFLAGMSLVIVADDAFVFLFSWELMSLSSWAMVLAQHRDAANRHAAFVYLCMASFGTLLLLLAFGLMSGGSGGFDFAHLRENSGGMNSLVLALVLIGAGSKAGLVPLHVWLPLAHPAAPSHVSALMSGVMTKVAIYGFIRVVFDILGAPEWWWGLPLIILGGLSAAFGILSAMMERDLKRLLAYSTIENVGFIFVGLGLALTFTGNERASWAALAFAAALFHVFNHVLMKGLMFMVAGAVLAATGERDIDRLGGLIHRLPQTAALALVGALALSALPPLNGFVSEWLTFQAILVSPELDPWALRLSIPAVGAVLALAAALAAATFVRAFGLSFLGRPRSTAAADAREVDGFSRLAMGCLGLLCVFTGIFPGFVIDALAPILGDLFGATLPRQDLSAWFTLTPISAERSSYNGLMTLLFIALSGGLAALIIHRLGSHRVRRAPAWDCGFPEPSPLTQYSALSFAQPVRRVFGSIAFSARERVTMPAPGDLAPARLEVSMTDHVWQSIYGPVEAAVNRAADRINLLQFLSIRQYLALVFAALVILLTVLAIWG
ncbi:MAG: hydrogenase 4 subunit B [Rhodospirillaceae bacterium]|nr:hydrogenase 4 subunit B [Rhodospirillaceae bacterium]